MRKWILLVGLTLALLAVGVLGKLESGSSFRGDKEQRLEPPREFAGRLSAKFTRLSKSVGAQGQTSEFLAESEQVQVRLFSFSRCPSLGVMYVCMYECVAMPCI